MHCTVSVRKGVAPAKLNSVVMMSMKNLDVEHLRLSAVAIRIIITEVRMNLIVTLTLK